MANPRHKHATTHAAQQNRRRANTIGQQASQAAADAARMTEGVGDASQAAADATRMAEGAGDNAARAGADLFEGTAGAVERLWRSGLDTTSHFTEQFARSMGLPHEKAQQAVEQSSHNIDAIVEFSRAYADALDRISRELSRLCRERFAGNLEKMNEMIRSRTPQELIAAQGDLFRDNLEGFLQSSRRVAETSIKAADQATRQLTEIIENQRRAA